MPFFPLSWHEGPPAVINDLANDRDVTPTTIVTVEEQNMPPPVAHFNLKVMDPAASQAQRNRRPYTNCEALCVDGGETAES